MVGNIQLRPKLWHLLNFYICCVCSFQLYMCVCVYLEILIVIFANIKFFYEAPKISHFSQCCIYNMNWIEWTLFTDGTTILLHSSVLPCFPNLYAMNHICILIYCIAVIFYTFWEIQLKRKTLCCNRCNWALLCCHSLWLQLKKKYYKFESGASLVAASGSALMKSIPKTIFNSISLTLCVFAAFVLPQTRIVNV